MMSCRPPRRRPKDATPRRSMMPQRHTRHDVLAACAYSSPFAAALRTARQTRVQEFDASMSHVVMRPQRPGNAARYVTMKDATPVRCAAADRRDAV